MADRYLVSGGTGDYDSTTNWSTASGGASGASKPVAADRIIIDANSLNVPLTVSSDNSCLSFTATNYTGSVVINAILSVVGATTNGNITLSTGMLVTGTGSIRKTPTSTNGVINTNGVIIGCNYIHAPSGATTTNITGLMQVTGNFTCSLNSIVVNTFNTSVGGNGSISVGGNIIHNSPMAGNIVFSMIGSTPATITQVATRYLGTNLVINKGAGAFNQVDLYWGASGRTLTYTSGVVNHTGILFVLSNGTLNTSGMNWNTIAPQGTVNFTSVCNSNKIGRNSASTAASFGGTFGFITNEFEFIFTSLASTSNILFTGNIEYKINTSIIATSENLANVLGVGFRCNSGVAIINLKEDAFMKLIRMLILNINASNKTLRTLRGTVTTSQNCFKIDSNINAYSTTR